MELWLRLLLTTTITMLAGVKGLPLPENRDYIVIPLKYKRADVAADHKALEEGTLNKLEHTVRSLSLSSTI
jgi:hypothetical protein